MAKINEVSVGEAVTPDDDIETVTDDANPAPSEDSVAALSKSEAAQSFDLAAWIGLVRPTRRSVTIYGRLDLLAEIDELAEREMRTTGKDAEACRERATELNEQLVASGVTFTVEGRSGTWVSTFEKRLDKKKVKDPTKRLLMQVAEQIVEPEGVTYSDLRALADVTEAQVTKLAHATVAANTAVHVSNPRFSRASSDSPAGLA